VQGYTQTTAMTTTPFTLSFYQARMENPERQPEWTGAHRPLATRELASRCRRRRAVLRDAVEERVQVRRWLGVEVPE
jgi:hypothetical protein